MGNIWNTLISIWLHRQMNKVLVDPESNKVLRIFVDKLAPMVSHVLTEHTTILGAGDGTCCTSPTAWYDSTGCSRIESKWKCLFNLLLGQCDLQWLSRSRSKLSWAAIYVDKYCQGVNHLWQTHCDNFRGTIHGLKKEFDSPRIRKIAKDF